MPADNTLMNLPVELIIEIFKFLPDKDIESNIIRVNKHFNKIASQYFLDTLYSKVLRFSQWQQTQYNFFNQSLYELDKSYNVTLFHKPNLAPATRFFYGKMNYLTISVLALFAAINVFKCIAAINAHFNDEAASTFKYGYLIIVLLASFFPIAMRTIIPSLQARTQNREYQNQLFRNIYVTEKEKFNTFKKHFEPLLADPNLSINKLTPTTTVGEFRSILQRTKTEVEELSTAFVKHLKKISRFQNLRQFSISDCPEEFTQHAISINKMWSNMYPNDSLFNMDENYLDESKEENIRLAF